MDRTEAAKQLEIAAQKDLEQSVRDLAIWKACCDHERRLRELEEAEADKTPLEGTI